MQLGINAIIKCSVRRTLHYDLVPWKGEIPFGDGEVHSIRLLDTANEAGYCTSDAAVIVHYAKFFQGRAEGPKDHFLDTDKTLQRFIKNTHIPVKDKSPFSFDDLVDWIRAHKDSAILPPSVFLDDILQEWDKHSKP